MAQRCFSHESPSLQLQALSFPLARVAITSQQLALSQGLGCAAITLQTVMQGKLHLWGTSYLMPPHAALHLCALRVREWKQFRTLFAMLHGVVASQGLVPSEAHIPARDPVSQSSLSTL